MSTNQNTLSPSRLFTYVLRYDTGFAPNPFHGYCTLATCKPMIRGSAEIGDWVVGIGSVRNGTKGKVVYAMQVEEILDFDQYWRDPRFGDKRPALKGGPKQRCGDNIYHRDPQSGNWIQESGFHSRKDIERDTKSTRVLISRRFAYFGTRAIEIPCRFRSWNGRDHFATRPGHRCRYPTDLQDAVIAWLLEQSDFVADVAGEPSDFEPSCSVDVPLGGCATLPRRRHRSGRS